MKLLKLPQPSTKKRVYEFALDGWFGKFISSKNWAGTTLPLPLIVLIFYYIGPSMPTLDPLVRVHEFQHVLQDQANPFWLISWVRYIWQDIKGFVKTRSLMGAYMNNEFEIAAYAYEDEVASGKVPMPEWAK